MERPLGLTIISGVVTLIGGSLTLSLFIEVIDAIRLLGLYGISIESPAALLGFFLYGIVPIFFYSLGVGLFMGKAWSYEIMLKIFPFTFFLFLTSSFVSLARFRMYVPLSYLRILVLRPKIILWALFFTFIIVWPMITYLKLPFVKLFFEQDKNPV